MTKRLMATIVPLLPNQTGARAKNHKQLSQRDYPELDAPTPCLPGKSRLWAKISLVKGLRGDSPPLGAKNKLSASSELLACFGAKACADSLSGNKRD